MTQYCKALMHYAKVSFHQVKEAFHKPLTYGQTLHNLDSRDSGTHAQKDGPLAWLKKTVSCSRHYPETNKMNNSKSNSSTDDIIICEFHNETRAS